MSLLVTIAVLLAQQAARGDVPERHEWEMPDEVRECLAGAQRQAQARIKVNFALNPYYLRGDFDGDGTPDIALAVLSIEPERFAISVCLSRKRQFLLGGGLNGEKKPFLDQGMPDPADRVISLGWQVVSKASVLRMLAANGTGRNRTMAAKLRPLRGEILYLPEDEGKAFIYFDGLQFRHHTIDSLALVNEHE